MSAHLEGWKKGKATQVLVSHSYRRAHDVGDENKIEDTGVTLRPGAPLLVEPNFSAEVAEEIFWATQTGEEYFLVYAKEVEVME